MPGPTMKPRYLPLMRTCICCHCGMFRLRLISKSSSEPLPNGMVMHLLRLSRNPEMSPNSLKICWRIGPSFQKSLSTSAVSSAYARTSVSGHLSSILSMSTSATVAYMSGDSGHPCRTPASKWNPSEVQFPWRIWQYDSLYSDCMVRIATCGIPIARNVVNMNSCEMLGNADAKSISMSAPSSS